MLDLKLKNFFNFQKKRPTLILAVLALVFFGLLAPGGFAHAIDIGGIVMGAIYILIYIIFVILFNVAYFIAWLAAYIASVNLNPAIINQVFANPALYQGWTIIRDVCNLLFLLLMLLVAFGTIVQHQKYNIKNSLPALILALFLTNFSWVIAGAIIDFGNILMYGILEWMCPASSSTCFQDLTSSLMVVIDEFRDEYNPVNIVTTGITAQHAIGVAVATIYTYVYAFILLALAIFLIIRMGALALLLILSPFAYFGRVMPGMEKIADRWWSSIWSYTLFGPIFVLMLYISAELAKNTMIVPAITNPALGAYGTLIATIVSNSLPLIFLLGIIPITRELGLAGTNAILSNTTGWRDGLARYAGGAADRFAARGANMTGTSVGARVRRGLSYVSPGAWKRAIKTHQAEQEHDYDVAAGKMRAQYSRTDSISGKKSVVDFEQEAHEREVARANKDILTENTDELVHQLDEALKGGLMVRAEALARKIAAKGDTDALLKHNNMDVSPEGFTDYYKKNFEPKVGAKKTALLMADIKELESKDGNKSLKGTTDFDAKNNMTVIRDTSTAEGKEKLLKSQVDAFYKDNAQKAMSSMNKKTFLDEVRDLDEDGNVQRDDNGNIKYKWQMADRGHGIIEKMSDQYFNKLRNTKGTELEKIDEAFAAEKAAVGGNWNNLSRKVGETDKDYAERIAKYERFEKELDGVFRAEKPKKKFTGGGMGVGQVENQISENENKQQKGGRGGRQQGGGGGGAGAASGRQSNAGQQVGNQDENSDEEDEEEGEGPQPISGGSVSKEDFVKETFADIRTEAKNIKSRSDLDNLRSKFAEAINLTDVGKEFEDIKRGEVEKTLEAIREADDAIKKEQKTSIEPPQNTGNDDRESFVGGNITPDEEGNVLIVNNELVKGKINKKAEGSKNIGKHTKEQEELKRLFKEAKEGKGSGVGSTPAREKKNESVEDLMSQGISRKDAERLVTQRKESEDDFEEVRKGIETYRNWKQGKGSQISMKTSQNVVVDGKEIIPESGEVVVENGKIIKGKLASEIEKKMKEKAEKGNAGKTKGEVAGNFSIGNQVAEPPQTEKSNDWTEFDKTATPNMSASEYENRINKLNAYKSELKENAKKYEDKPGLANPINKGIGIVNAQIAHTIGKQTHQAQVKELTAKYAKKSGKKESEVLNEVLKSDEYKKLDLKDKFNDLDLKAEAARLDGKTDEYAKMISEKRQTARKYAEETDPYIMTRIDKFKKAMRSYDGRKITKTEQKRHEMAAKQLVNLRKEIEEKTDEILNEK